MKKYISISPIRAPLLEETSGFLSYHNPLGKLLYMFSVFVLILAVITLSIFLYWAIQPATILTFKTTPIPVEKKQVKAGDVQVLDFDFCKHADVTGAVVWSLVSNKSVIVLPSYRDTTPKGCATLRAPIILPTIRASDTYRVRYIIFYQINPIKQVTVTFDTQSFKIIGTNDF